MKQLTEKQQNFVAVLTKTGNATEAARKSYAVNPKNANKLAYNLKHKANIKQALETALVRLNLTAEYSLKGFKALHERHFDNNPNASVRALENIAQIQNLYPSAKSVSLDDGNFKSVSWLE